MVWTALLLLSLLPQGDASDVRGRMLSFSAPKRVFPTGNSTARTWGGVYADAFYAIGRGALFGVPGVTAASAPNVTNNHAVLSTDGGQSWRQWYPTSYVNVATGYPFTAVPNASNASGAGLHDLGDACASTAGTPQSSFANNGSVGSWGSEEEGAQPHHGSVPAAVSFSALPIPLTCVEGGPAADCFWLHAGGTTALPEALGGGLLLTNCVPWLHGKFGATAAGAGVFAWHSADGLRWTFRGTVATAAEVPASGEGPNENDVSLLADGRTLLVVFRVDDGVDGGAVGAKNYLAATSTDGGRTWSSATEMIDVNGRGIGVARPRLLLLGDGGGDAAAAVADAAAAAAAAAATTTTTGGGGGGGGGGAAAAVAAAAGPLLLSGGRLYTEHTRDILLWVCWDGMGTRWEPYSISYQHNQLVAPAALRFSAAVNATTGRATTSYTSLLRLDGGRGACIVYNGETGIFAMEISIVNVNA